MDRTACTVPQCLYKGDLYLYLLMHSIPTQINPIHILIRTFLIMYRRLCF